MKIAFKFDDGKIVSHEVFERAFTVGRSSNCRISFESEHFSREHALVEFIDGDVYITDLESKNGIFINHVRIPKRMKIKYDLKLPLYMGACFLTFDIREDLKDRDHLSLETFSKVDAEEMYRPMNPPKKIAPRPRPVHVPQKKFLDGKSFLIVGLLLGALLAFNHYRPNLLGRFTIEKTK
jgi:pSer/pThr/pTyr-binding forkhead associated (FHA) protein